VWDAVWQPFGGLHSFTGSATLNARLPGQWFQSETLLHYNWHRSYDPNLGRYTQPDPLGFVDCPSVYGYAGGSPVIDVDPEGLWIGIVINFLRTCTVDGPSKAFLRYGNGRVIQVRCLKVPVCRVDFQPLPGTNNSSRLHLHIWPDMKTHWCLDPRGCGSAR
jgi:RHS repeat-associated protein